MKRVPAILLLLGGMITLTARPANPFSVGADLALHFYQKLISPLQGGHICNFSPTCSAFSRRSYRLYGPFWGTLMTFDRLERCNPGAWGHLGTYYSRIEADKLYDPPGNHYLPGKLERKKEKSGTSSAVLTEEGEGD